MQDNTSKLKGALKMMLERMPEPPDANCSCHISPPCNDCVDHAGEREAFEYAQAVLAEVEDDTQHGIDSQAQQLELERGTQLAALAKISRMTMSMYANAGEAMREAKRIANQAIAAAQPAQTDQTAPGLYAILYRDNWDGEGYVYHILAEHKDGKWYAEESGKELLQYQGDAILRVWPLTNDKAQPTIRPVGWGMNKKTVTALAAELVRGAECMGDDDTELVLEVRVPGTIRDDDGNLNAGPVLAISDAEYPEEGVYPIDPQNPTAGREQEAQQQAQHHCKNCEGVQPETCVFNAKQAQQAEPVAWQLFKQALFVGMERDCLHYLMANAHGRRDGALKAKNHEDLCRHIVAAVRGCDPDMVRRHHEDDYQAVHDGTQALTDYLDEVIGFPLWSRPDYDDLTPKFFDKFFELAMAALGMSPAAQPPAVADGCGACGDGCKGQGCRLERESPPTCQTCNGKGMIGGLLPNGGGYDGEPCPDCSAPQAAVAVPEAARLLAAIEYAEGMLTNLQPHIPQACYPHHMAFIDNYVDPVLERLRAEIAAAQKGGAQ